MIVISYLSPVLHPHSTLSVFTDCWQFLPFIRISTLRTPHATCIFMSHRVSLVKPSPFHIRALHNYFFLGILEDLLWASISVALTSLLLFTVSLNVSEPYNKLLLIIALQMLNFLSLLMFLLHSIPLRHAIHFLAFITLDLISLSSVPLVLNYIMTQKVQTESSKTKLCKRLRCMRLCQAN